MLTRRHGAGAKSQGPRVSDDPFTATSSPTTRHTGGTVTTATVYDEIVDTATSASVTTEGVVSVYASLDSAPPVLTNVTPSIASLDSATGQLTCISNGTAVVNVSIGSLILQTRTTIGFEGAATTSTPVGFASGSLAKHCYDWYIAAVAGKTANATTMDFIASGGARSGTTWLGALDTSCIITGASNGWHQGALVAPRFAVVAQHVGSTSSYSCVANNGTTETRNTISSASLGNDKLLVCFDAPFTSVTPAKILPANFGTKYKPGQAARYGVPLVKWKRTTGVVGVGIGAGGYRFIYGGTGVGLSAIHPGAFTDWYVEWVSGDSGSPFGTVINGMFVFLGCAASGPGTNDDGGSFVSSDIAGLQSAMNSLVSGSSSTLNFIDLSGFNTY